MKKSAKFSFENGGGHDIVFYGDYITVWIQKPGTNKFYETDIYITPYSEIAYPLIIGEPTLRRIGYRLVLLDSNKKQVLFKHEQETIAFDIDKDSQQWEMIDYLGGHNLSELQRQNEESKENDDEHKKQVEGDGSHDPQVEGLNDFVGLEEIEIKDAPILSEIINSQRAVKAVDSEINETPKDELLKNTLDAESLPKELDDESKSDKPHIFMQRHRNIMINIPRHNAKYRKRRKRKTKKERREQRLRHQYVKHGLKTQDNKLLKKQIGQNCIIDEEIKDSQEESEVEEDEPEQQPPASCLESINKQTKHPITSKPPLSTVSAMKTKRIVRHNNSKYQTISNNKLNRHYVTKHNEIKHYKMMQKINTLETLLNFIDKYKYNGNVTEKVKNDIKTMIKDVYLRKGLNISKRLMIILVKYATRIGSEKFDFGRLDNIKYCSC